MNRVMVVFGPSLHLVERAGIAGSCAIVLALTFLTTADVIARYVFNSPIPGTYELSELLFVCMVFLAVSYVQSVRGHVSVEVFTTWLPLRFQVALDILGLLVGLGVIGVITWQGAISALQAWGVGDHTLGLVQYPVWPAKMLLPIGTGLLCLRLISHIIHDVSGLFKPGAYE